MKKLLNIARTFRDDEDGAAMVEYSILIGIIAVASIATIAAIGVWVSDSFTGLCDGLTAAEGVADCDATG